MSKHLAFNLVVLGLAAALAVVVFQPVAGNTLSRGIAAPEFTHALEEEWINSAPLTLADLKGKVVLIDFWTFDCWNCYRSFPWMKAMEDRLSGEDFQIIGVHTPEFAHEKIRKNITAKVVEFGLQHPVMIDNDFSYWRAMGNRYWPAFYLLDKKGEVRALFVGETHEGDEQALRIEAMIKALLQEPGS